MFSPVKKLTVSCALPIDGVGLTAHLNVIGIPLVIPPFIPPLLFVFVVMLPFSQVNWSLISLPKEFAKSMPNPNSTPLIPPIENSAWERILSIESNQGSPTPAGIPTIAVSIIPPIESFSFAAFSIFSIISSAFSSEITGKALF